MSNSFKDSVPPEYVRKQTLTTGERFITEELKRFVEKILTSGERAIQIESKPGEGTCFKISLPRVDEID